LSEFSTSLVKLIVSLLTDRKFKALEGGKFSTPRKIAAGISHGSVLSPVLYTIYTNDAPLAAGTPLCLFADDTYIYATEKHRHSVLCKLQ
jgi:hypothetical protein